MATLSSTAARGSSAAGGGLGSSSGGSAAAQAPRDDKSDESDAWYNNLPTSRTKFAEVLNRQLQLMLGCHCSEPIRDWPRELEAWGFLKAIKAFAKNFEKVDADSVFRWSIHSSKWPLRAPDQVITWILDQLQAAKALTVQKNSRLLNLTLRRVGTTDCSAQRVQRQQRNLCIINWVMRNLPDTAFANWPYIISGLHPDTICYIVQRMFNRGTKTRLVRPKKLSASTILTTILRCNNDATWAFRGQCSKLVRMLIKLMRKPPNATQQKLIDAQVEAGVLCTVASPTYATHGGLHASPDEKQKWEEVKAQQHEAATTSTAPLPTLSLAAKRKRHSTSVAPPSRAYSASGGGGSGGSSGGGGSGGNPSLLAASSATAAETSPTSAPARKVAARSSPGGPKGPKGPKGPTSVPQPMVEDWKCEAAAATGTDPSDWNECKDPWANSFVHHQTWCGNKRFVVPIPVQEKEDGDGLLMYLRDLDAASVDELLAAFNAATSDRNRFDVVRQFVWQHRDRAARASAAASAAAAAAALAQPIMTLLEPRRRTSSDVREAAVSAAFAAATNHGDAGQDNVVKALDDIDFGSDDSDDDDGSADTVADLTDE